MLRIGGRMVYSTCTFSPEEDEQCILQFLDTHPLYRLIQVPLYDGMQHGLIKDAQSAIRLWPHKLHGEGHFVAVLEKGENTADHAQAGTASCSLSAGDLLLSDHEVILSGKKNKNSDRQVSKKETAQNPNVRSLRIILSYPLFTRYACRSALRPPDNLWGTDLPAA